MVRNAKELPAKPSLTEAVRPYTYAVRCAASKRRGNDAYKNLQRFAILRREVDIVHVCLQERYPIDTRCITLLICCTSAADKCTLTLRLS
jgi:hypothetical protein